MVIASASLCAVSFLYGILTSRNTFSLASYRVAGILERDRDTRTYGFGPAPAFATMSRAMSRESLCGSRLRVRLTLMCVTVLVSQCGHHEREEKNQHLHEISSAAGPVQVRKKYEIVPAPLIRTSAERTD